MTTPLVLHPAAPASPALKHALLPELRDTVPGNAVPRYRQAAANLEQDSLPREEWYAAFDRWMAAPLQDFPRDEVDGFLARCETTLREADAAARSERCDWGLTEELRKNGFAQVLSEMQAVRAVAMLFALRVRREAAEGRADRAVRALQNGLAMARHAGESPMFIPALVGMAIAAIMLGRLEELIQQPGALNLYWPLTDLPRPFFDLRRPMQGERVWAYGCFPGTAETAADLNARPWSADQVEATVARLLEQLRDDPGKAPNAGDEAELLRRVEARHEAAKKALIEEGRPKELVDAMPPVQVALVAAFRQYDRICDEYLKVQSLTHGEAEAAVRQADARRKALADDADGPALPIARVFLPAAAQVFAARTRVDRSIAALRCVEAVRLHAAAHAGALPASLDEIEDAPVPADPFTGQPFGYRLADGRALLTSPPVPGRPLSDFNAPNYELMFQR